MADQIFFIPFGGPGGGGEANIGANVGTGPGESYRDKTGVTLNFRTLKSSDGSVDITTSGDEIDLKAQGGGGDGTPCIPLIKNVGSQFGARYVGLVNVADGGSSRDRGIYLGGVFAGLKNLYSESDQTTLVVVEDESDPSQHLAIVYLRNTRSPFGRIALVQNGKEQLSVPAPLDTHPTLIAAVLDVGEGPTEPFNVSIVVGASVMASVDQQDFNWVAGAQMRLRVGEGVNGDTDGSFYHTGGVFLGVPSIAIPSPDAVASAMEPAALSGRLDDLEVGLIQAQVWSVSSLKADPSLSPWPKLGGGDGLTRTALPPIYYDNCTPGWAPAQMGAGGENLGSGFNIFSRDASAPSYLKFRSLVSGSGIELQQNEDDVFIGLEPADSDKAYLGFKSWTGASWTLPKNNADPEVVPTQLKTEAVILGSNFAEVASGDGGQVDYNGDTKTFRISINFSAVRPPSTTLDARGEFYIGVRPNGLPDFVEDENTIQWCRFNIVDADANIHLESLTELNNGDRIALMATSDAGAGGAGLGIQLKGYTLVITEA